VDLPSATQCVHERSRMAFAAAVRAGLAGEFRVFERDGLLVQLTTSPGLGFLSAVTGLTADSLAVLPGVLAECRAGGAPMPAVVIPPADARAAEDLRRLGFDLAGQRVLGIMSLATRDAAAPVGQSPGHRITEAVTAGERQVYLGTLAAGCAAAPDLTRFIVAKHADEAVRGFVAWRGSEPAGAAAFWLHQGVVVMGGAATLPAARGAGVHAALLSHRLRQAMEAGATAAVVTAGAGSVSARNLARAGFALHRGERWLYQLP
jgi:GNAT superfamily N-acetyltransferase